MRVFSRSKFTINTGGLAEAVTYLAANDTPQVLIVETDATGDGLYQALEGLAEVCSPDSKVILIGHENDIELYRQLVSMGLSEYFTDKVTTEQLATSIEGMFTEADAAQLGRVIAFAGARGGVGSSTIAANTAYALAKQQDDNVILIDLDLAYGTAALSFNLQQKQSLVDALAQPGRLDDVLMARFMLKYDDHLSVVPSPSNLGGNYSIDLEPFGVLMKLVRQMSPYVILDLPHQWAPWIGEVMADVNELVVVAYPDLVCLRDAKNLYETVVHPRGASAPTRLVLNKVGLAKRTELTAKDFEGALSAKPDAIVPFDPNSFGTALNNGQMVTQAAKNSKAAQQIGRLATLVTGKEEKKGKGAKKSAFSFLKSTG